MKYPYGQAKAIADELVQRLATSCERIEIAGSLRRLRNNVGDIEILYIPKFSKYIPAGELLEAETLKNLADSILDELLSAGIISKRKTSLDRAVWGESNKLALHAETGIPVDFFATTENCWSNYLVCRTGPAESNMRIASIAKARGWKWHPYGPGFSRRIGALQPDEWFIVGSEKDVFDFVGIPFLPPEKRG